MQTIKHFHTEFLLHDKKQKRATKSLVTFILKAKNPETYLQVLHRGFFSYGILRV